MCLQAGERGTSEAAGHHPSSGPNPGEPRFSPSLHLGPGQSEAHTQLFLNKHTHAHAEPPGDPSERDTSGHGHSMSPGTGTANNTPRRAPLIEAGSEQQGTCLIRGSRREGGGIDKDLLSAPPGPVSVPASDRAREATPALPGENLEYSQRGGRARAPWGEPVPTSDSTKR